MFKLVGLGLALLLLSGCASYGVIHNKPAGAVESQQAYSIKQLSGRRGSGDIALMLAFSGGGTRAAALAYGVLQELRDTTLVIDGQPRRLLDEVDTISSVSGGSFTSAYYGLYGDRLFADFEDVFLRRDVQGTLLHSLFNPLGWFRSTGRTETAVKYYEEVVFQGATFADVPQPEQLAFFNHIPTSFDLSNEQVDKLIAAGRELLRNNPDFQGLLTELGR